MFQRGILLSVLVVLGFSISAHSALRCDQIHLRKTINSSQPKSLLQTAIEKIQASSDYSVDPKTGILVRMEQNGTRTVVGQLEEISPKYLYEWQDQSFHDHWIKEGGVSKEEMDYILTQKAQFYGRGYYVSLSPTDSANFGSHITVFKVDKPIVVLKTMSVLFYNSPAGITRLREFGISGNKAGNANKTWYNIFNEAYLGKAVELDYATYLEIQKPGNYSGEMNVAALNKPAVLAKALNDLLTNKAFIDKIEKLNIGSLSADQKQLLQASFVQNPKILLNSSLSAEAKIRLAKQLYSEMTIEQMSKVSKTITDQKELSAIADSLNQILESIPSANVFFKLFDLFDIATTNSPKMKEPLPMDVMIKASAEYEAAFNQINFRKIKSAESFRQTLESAFHLDFAVRDYDVIMSSYKKRKTNMTISKAYLTYLKANPFLSIQVIKESNKQPYFETEVEVTYLNLDNSLPLSKLLTGNEKRILTNIRNRNTESSEGEALAFAIGSLEAKFFDPAFFSAINAVINRANPKAPITALSLYKAFVSLHPYKDANGRAARLYYNWLTAVHFKSETKDPMFFVNESDLFTTPKTSDQEVAWYNSRLWVSAAKNKEEMIARAKAVLLNETNHRGILLNLYDLKSLVVGN